MCEPVFSYTNKSYEPFPQTNAQTHMHAALCTAFEGVGALLRASQVVLVVENTPANAEDRRDTVWPLGRKNPLEEEMATHSSVLAWRIPGTEEPSGL